jgi:hypothetical protein
MSRTRPWIFFAISNNDLKTFEHFCVQIAPGLSRRRLRHSHLAPTRGLTRLPSRRLQSLADALKSQSVGLILHTFFKESTVMSTCPLEDLRLGCCPSTDAGERPSLQARSRGGPVASRRRLGRSHINIMRCMAKQCISGQVLRPLALQVCA